MANSQAARRNQPAVLAELIKWAQHQMLSISVAWEDRSAWRSLAGLSAAGEAQQISNINDAGKKSPT